MLNISSKRIDSWIFFKNYRQRVDAKYQIHFPSSLLRRSVALALRQICFWIVLWREFVNLCMMEGCRKAIKCQKAIECLLINHFASFHRAAAAAPSYVCRLSSSFKSIIFHQSTPAWTLFMARFLLKKKNSATRLHIGPQTIFPSLFYSISKTSHSSKKVNKKLR